MSKPLSIYRTDAQPGSGHDAGSRVPGNKILVPSRGRAARSYESPSAPPPCATEEIAATWWIIMAAMVVLAVVGFVVEVVKSML